MNDPHRNPRLPSDLGLPSLGLVMQAVAGAAIGLGSFAGVGFLLAPSRLPASAHLAALAALVLGLVRGVVHLNAGRELARRGPELQRATRRYVITAVVTTLLTIGLALWGLGAAVPPVMLVLFAMVALAWPIALSLLVFRRSVTEALDAAETFEVDLAPSDRSIEGAGVLMTLFGVFGIALALMAVTTVTLDGAGPGLYGALVVLVILAFAGRSIVHVIVGVQASRGLRPAAFQARTFVYVTAAVISAGVLALLLLAVLGGGAVLVFLLLLPCLAFALLTWPLALRSFAHHAVMTDIGEGEGTVAFGPAPDRGLTAFGYLLVFYGSSTLALALAQLLLLPFAGPEGLGVLAAAPGGELWMVPIEAGLTLWAGIELVGMSARYRVATIAFGLASLAFLALRWPLIADAEAQSFGAPLAFSALLAAMMVAMPVMALVLSTRRLPATSAEP